MFRGLLRDDKENVTVQVTVLIMKSSKRVFSAMMIGQENNLTMWSKTQKYTRKLRFIR